MTREPDNPTSLLYAARSPKRHGHVWFIPAGVGEEGEPYCTVCGIGLAFYEARSRRGRTNRKRGNAIELEIARALGLRKVGMFGGPEDVGTRDDPFLIQVKSRSGRAYPEWVERELAKLPVTAQQTPLLVIAEAGGKPGQRRRALVVLRMEDWIALHGPAGEVA